MTHQPAQADHADHAAHAAQAAQAAQVAQVARCGTGDNPLSVDLLVTGEVDLASVGQLHIASTRVLSKPEASGLRLDLSSVTFIDATGVGALITIRNAAAHHGMHLVLTSPAPCVRRILTLTQLTDFFDIDNPESHALDHERTPNA